VRVLQVGVGLEQRVHDAFQRLFLLAEILGAFRIVPDGRIF
jgi:hypothetical protein